MTGPTPAPAAAMVDVVIPTYGPPRYLEEAIRSVLAQDHPAFTLRVMDNGPGDGEAAEIVARHGDDPRIVHVPTGEVVPQHESWTRCIRLGDAAYVAMLHDDDTWDPGWLARRVAFMEAHPRCGLVFSGMRDVDEAGRPLLETSHKLAAGLHTPQEFVPLLLDEMVVGSPTALVRRSAYEAVGSAFSQEVREIDWEMWLRIALRFPTGYLTVRDCDRRVHQASLTSAIGGWGEKELERLDHFERLVEEAAEPVAWPRRARQGRRAASHLIVAMDAVEAGRRRDALTAVRRAVRTHPPAVLDPRASGALVAVAAGAPGRRAIASLRARQQRRRVGVHLRDVRRGIRDLRLRRRRG